MPEITLDLKELEAVQRALSKLSAEGFRKFARRATHQVALLVKGKATRYPGRSHSPVKWSSDRQRRAYFAMRREEGYPLRYTRGNDPMSQRLQQSWTVERGQDSATLSNSATYAPYVMAEGFQTPQHKATGWRTLTQIVKTIRQAGTMDKIVIKEIRRAIRESLRS